MEEIEKESNLDSANVHPLKRYTARNFTTNFLIYLILIIPAFVFYMVSVLIGLSTAIGITLSFITFIILVYLTWKRELWNKIRG
jgi:hypothetical protein